MRNKSLKMGFFSFLFIMLIFISSSSVLTKYSQNLIGYEKLNNTGTEYLHIWNQGSIKKDYYYTEDCLDQVSNILGEQWEIVEKSIGAKTQLGTYVFELPFKNCNRLDDSDSLTYSNNTAIKRVCIKGKCLDFGVKSHIKTYDDYITQTYGFRARVNTNFDVWFSLNSKNISVSGNKEWDYLKVFDLVTNQESYYNLSKVEDNNLTIWLNSLNYKPYYYLIDWSTKEYIVNYWANNTYEWKIKLNESGVNLLINLGQFNSGELKTFEKQWVDAGSCSCLPSTSGYTTLNLPDGSSFNKGDTFTMDCKVTWDTGACSNCLLNWTTNQVADNWKTIPPTTGQGRPLSCNGAVCTQKNPVENTIYSKTIKCENYNESSISIGCEDESFSTEIAEDFGSVTCNEEDVVFPVLNWTDPTPSNNSKQSSDSVYLNTTITDTSDFISWFDWNHSLVGYWAMDWNSSTQVFDNSTFKNHGDLENADTTNIISGKFGNGFDTSITQKNRLNITGSSVDILGNITLSAWVKPTWSQTDAKTHFIFEKRGRTNANAYRLFFFPSTDDWRFRFTTTAGTTNCDTAGITITANRWYHILARYNGTGASIWIDGNNNVSCATTGTLTHSSSDLLIGDTSVNGNSAFNGTIDEAMIFDRALSDEEILALYDGGSNRLYHNFTNLVNGTYNYSAFAMDTGGNINMTTMRVIIIGKTALKPEFWAISLIIGLLGIPLLLLFVSAKFDSKEHGIFKLFLRVVAMFMVLININIGLILADYKGYNNIVDNFTIIYWTWNMVVYVSLAIIFVGVIIYSLLKLKKSGEREINNL